MIGTGHRSVRQLPQERHRPLNRRAPLHGRKRGQLPELTLESLETRIALSAIGFDAVAYAVGSSPLAVATADLNADGLADLVLANSASSNLSVLLNRGDGSFAPGTNYPAGRLPQAVAVGDFNKDGKPDLVAVNPLDNAVSILYGTGSGAFAAPIAVGAGTNPASVATGDFNADGATDIAVSNSAGFAYGKVTILISNGNGTFKPAVSYTAGFTPGPLVIGDLNGDGKLDVAVLNQASYEVGVYLGTGTGAFTAAPSCRLTDFVASIALGDMNGDGKADLLTANYYGHTLGVMLGNGDATFSPAAKFTAGFYPTAAVAADFNQDGKLDAAVIDAASSAVVLLLGDGHGTLGTPLAFATGDTPIGLVASDFDADGKPDLAIANRNANTVSVLLNDYARSSVLADAGGPYSIDEATIASLSAAGSTGTGLTYAWDFDADGVFGESAYGCTFGDENGVHPLFSALSLDGPASRTIRLRVTDGSGHSTTDTATINILNVPPALIISGPASASPGSPYTLSLSSSDPASDTIASWLINWGDGNQQTVAGNPSSVTHTYMASGSYTITASATDEDGAYSAGWKPVTVVGSTGPVLTITGSSSVNEGAAYTLGLSSTTALTSWLINWGDGASNTLAGGSTSATHTYADNGNYTIAASGTDASGTYNANAKAVAVGNVPPTISITGNASVNEGAVYTLTLGSVVDPGADAVSSFIVNWGDGTTSTYTAAGAKTHTYADGPLAASITVSLVDEDGTYNNIASKAVAVANVPPVLAISGAGWVATGSTYTLSLAAADPGADTINSWLIGWGDGNQQTVVGNPSSVTHTYTATGSYAIAASATDEDGTYNANGKAVTVVTAFPQATSSPSGISVGGEATYEFAVIYADDLGVDPATLDSQDILVTGPNGYSEPAEFVSAERADDGTVSRAIYRISAPGGSWDSSDNGTYAITLQDGQVSNVAGGAAPAATLATFDVGIADTDTTSPTATISTASLAPAAVACTFTVTYVDDSALDLSSINGNDIFVTGPNGYSELATLVSVTMGDDGASAVVTYNIPAPGGFWDPGDNGRYSFELCAEQVADAAGNFAVGGYLGTMSVKLRADYGSKTPRKARLVSLPASGEPAAITGFLFDDSPQDYYKYVAERRTRFAAKLGNLLSPAQVQVLDASGQIIRSASRNTARGTYFTGTLPAGRYYVRVLLTGPEDTGYILQLSALPAAANTPAPRFATAAALASAAQKASANWVILTRADPRLAGLFNSTGSGIVGS